MATVWPQEALDDEVVGAIRAALVLGPERTLQADIAFGFQQLSDIAIKALSPGINDPTTAEICIDRLGELFVRLANRGKPDEVRSSDDGSVRVVLQGPPFEKLVDQTLDPIRHYGAGDPNVTAHLLDVLGRVAPLVPAEHCATIASQASRIQAAAMATSDPPRGSGTGRPSCRLGGRSMFHAGVSRSPQVLRGARNAYMDGRSVNVTWSCCFCSPRTTVTSTTSPG